MLYLYFCCFDSDAKSTFFVIVICIKIEDLKMRRQWKLPKLIRCIVQSLGPKISTVRWLAPKYMWWSCVKIKN